MITQEHYIRLVTRALTAMADIVSELGDEQANQRLPQPGANTPYAVLNHCLGATRFWAGEVVGGRPAQRDRDAEFAASGPVFPLVEQTHAAVEEFAKDVRAVDPRKPVDASLPWLGEPLDVGGALLHLYTDLVQHHGQLEIIRDVLTS